MWNPTDYHQVFFRPALTPIALAALRRPLCDAVLRVLVCDLLGARNAGKIRTPTAASPRCTTRCDPWPQKLQCLLCAVVHARHRARGQLRVAGDETATCGDETLKPSSLRRV